MTSIICVSTRVRLASLVLIAIPSITVQAQPPLFSEIMGDATSGSPPPGLGSAFPVVLNFADLQQGPDSLAIELPSLGMTVLAHRELWKPILGFDASGASFPRSFG